jgi:hypothetical protein
VEEELHRIVAASAGGVEFVTTHVTRVGGNFLETIGAPLLRGRTITAEDGIMAAPVAVISQPLAQKLFPGTEPIGERIAVTLEENRDQAFTIVGVSAAFATSQLTTARPQILLPLPDMSAGAVAKAEAPRQSLHLIARGAPGDEAKVKAALDSARRHGAGDLCGRFRHRRVRGSSGRASGRSPRHVHPANGGDGVGVNGRTAL